MNQRDGFVFIILFLFQGSMLTGIRNVVVGNLQYAIGIGVVPIICILILVTIPAENETELPE